MLQTVLLLLSISGLVRSSGIAVAPLGPSGPHAALGHPITANAPVVTAASSQYFERTFNRLIVPPIVAPVAPVAPPALAPGFPIAPAPTVFIEPAAVNPQPPPPLPQEPVQPNIAIAVATAHAAAPVATILLPPYPFGFPPTFGFIPSEQPNSIADENTKEPTTPKTTKTEVVTTPQPTSITPIDASSSDNNVEQALPSNENVNFNLYGPPLQGSKPQFQPVPGTRTPDAQMPNLQFQPQHPNTQVQVQRPNPQFQPQRPNPQFQPQWTNSPSQPKKPNVQFSPQNTKIQLQLQKPNTPYQQQPEFPPYPPRQQFHLQNQPQQKPQQQPLAARPHQHQLWPQQRARPQKLKTSVEVVPVPLVYITPPPLHKTHAHVKVVKHIYSFVPASSAKIILKPVKIRPVRLVKHKIVRLQNLRAEDRDIEITTLNPFRRSNTKPPRA